MLLRHIRPGSIEWQEAVASEAPEDRELLRLSPEETARLRQLAEVERISGPVDVYALGPPPPRRPLTLGGAPRAAMRA
jgi:hypothetical protein